MFKNRTEFLLWVTFLAGVILGNIIISTQAKMGAKLETLEHIASETILLKQEIASQSLQIQKLVEKFGDTQVIYAEEIRLNKDEIK